MSKPTFLTIRIDPALKTELQSYAKTESRSLSNFAILLIQHSIQALREVEKHNKRNGK